MFLSVPGLLYKSNPEHTRAGAALTSPWLSFPVKHVSYSQDLEISRVIEILSSSLWLPCILFCVSVYEITALCKLNGNTP